MVSDNYLNNMLIDECNLISMSSISPTIKSTSLSNISINEINNNNNNNDNNVVPINKNITPSSPSPSHSQLSSPSYTVPSSPNYKSLNNININENNNDFKINNLNNIIRLQVEIYGFQRFLTSVQNDITINELYKILEEETKQNYNIKIKILFINDYLHNKLSPDSIVNQVLKSLQKIYLFVTCP